MVIGFEQTVYNLDEVTGVNATYPLCVTAADPSQLGGQLQPSFSLTVDNQTATGGLQCSMMEQVSFCLNPNFPFLAEMHGL